ncbi:MAG TPA: S8 family serine peptidase, partial [Thermoanaerobaculia bacterium]|nr:S8 family serine peptidase [Thermoanaerobaculia bacterium]
MSRGLIWTPVLTMVLCLGAPAAAEVAVRIPAGVAAEGTDLAGARVIDYGSYSWVVSPAAARLAGAERFEGAGEVLLPGARFDPLGDGVPPAPVGLLPDSGERALRLVQLAGPPKSAWVDGWAGRGLEIVAYYPHFTYLVWAERAAVEAVAAEGHVRWHGRHLPPYAIDAGLAAFGDGSGRIALLVDTGGRQEALPEAIVELRALGIAVDRVSKAAADGRQWLLELVAPGELVTRIAALRGAIWVGRGSEGIRLEDEMSDQIVAGNHPGGVPVVGYGPHLAALGFDGAGVIWTIADTGVDWDHPDFAGRIVGGLTPPGAACSVPGQPGTDCAGGGHGTHVAGIVGADAAAGFTDANGFFYGLGVAPEVSLFAINVFSNIDFDEITQAALAGGSIGANNSWASGGPGAGYTAAARIQDLLVRDGDLDTAAVAEPFIQVFSAGNSGPGASTITEPKEAKNIISVANSLNFRAGNIDSLS